MMRGPFCGPAARPKFTLPTAPLTEKFVRLNALKASARNWSRIREPSPLGQMYTCFTSAMFSSRYGGCRKGPLYCAEVPYENGTGPHNSAGGEEAVAGWV